MASFYHCMNCHCLFSKDNKFYISSCIHIACLKCVELGAFTLKCRICQKENPQIHEIGASLNKAYRDLFTPMAESVKEAAQMVTQVIQFQHSQRRHLSNHLSHRSANFEKMRKFCEDTVQKKNQYKTQVVQLQHYNTKARQHIQALQQQLGQQRRPSVPQSGNAMNLTSMTHDPFRTPAPIGFQRSFFTSTPCETTGGFERNSSTDATVSFTTATGIPRAPNVTDGDMTMLAQRAGDVHLDGPNSFMSTMGSGGVKRSVVKNDGNASDRSTMSSNDFTIPAVTKSSSAKKSRIDIMSKTDPLRK